MNLKVDDENCKKVSFKNRKSTLKKKATQLSTLCDVNVCMVCFGPDGTVETWPENRSDVLDLIIKYKNLSEEGREKKKQKCNLLGFLEDKKRKLVDKLNRKVDDSSSMLLKNNLAGSAVLAWDERLNLFLEEELVGLCVSLDSKLQETRDKIRTLQTIEKDKKAFEVENNHEVDHVNVANNLNYDLMRFNGDCFHSNQPINLANYWPRDYHGRMMRSNNFGWSDNSNVGRQEILPFIEEKYNYDHMGIVDINNNLVSENKFSLGFADHANMRLENEENFGLMGESNQYFMLSHTSPASALHEILPISMRPLLPFFNQSTY
ncbi:hypothetical protein JRO89_XS03G0263200 [Xanthoceras sorbifolium]|uniref:MADS-box domain-containing protein n=1 Tax=Xanthoceras sorbifolium TaxID=99658 RepID=A0ABQ8IC44_9ROSI|nr:hypothetical protein JRO89_XS03G0263200 [Xanthoceras sorbifolium]